MTSVTHRINEIKQPRGGYVKPKSFSIKEYNDGITLHENENIHASLVGLSVDYLTRFMIFKNVNEAFKISIIGANLLYAYENTHKKSHNVISLLNNITGLDDTSIISATKLSGYDVVYRSGPMGYKPIEEIEPDTDTIENIRTMVKRSLIFFEEYGPITKEGFTFEGGYTSTVGSGDGDFLTADTLWDFKVSKNDITNKHTLQLLMYYIMGKHSIHEEFNHIKYLGIFNPRLNKVYTLDVNMIPEDIIKEVEDSVIGYNLDFVSQARVINDSNKDSLDILSLKDLAERYGVSTSTITKHFFDFGLPHYKKGNKYQINLKDLEKWEGEQRFIPYRKNEIIVLPTYYKVLDVLNEKLERAKINKDKESIKELKKTIKGYKLKSSSDGMSVVLGLVFLVIVIIFIIIMGFMLF